MRPERRSVRDRLTLVELPLQRKHPFPVFEEVLHLEGSKVRRPFERLSGWEDGIDDRGRWVGTRISSVVAASRCTTVDRRKRTHFLPARNGTEALGTGGGSEFAGRAVPSQTSLADPSRSSSPQVSFSSSSSSGTRSAYKARQASGEPEAVSRRLGLLERTSSSSQVRLCGLAGGQAETDADSCLRFSERVASVTSGQDDVV